MESSTQPTRADTTPNKIGRYELVRPLGEDSVARIFLARPLGERNRARFLAFKLVHPSLANDSSFRRAFLQQARIGVALRHPNIVRTYEVVAEPGPVDVFGKPGPARCYAVTELLRGRTLLQLLEERRTLSLELQLGVLLQVLEGLRYLHEVASREGAPLGLVHKNLTPARVLVGYDGRVRVLDCALARAHAIATARRDNPIMVMRYSAPEQCLGKKLDGRTDLYAVGVMLWEAIVGGPRQAGRTLAEVLHARVQNREPNVEDVVPDAPPELAAICRRALSWDPSERYASAAEMHRDLSRYVNQHHLLVGHDALSRTLHACYAADIASIEEMLLGAAVHAEPEHDVAGPASSSSTSGVTASGPAKHWGFRTPGPSTIPIVASVAPASGVARWPKLALGAVAGAAVGALLGLSLRPGSAPSPELAAGSESMVIAAPLAPSPPEPDTGATSNAGHATAQTVPAALEPVAGEAPAEETAAEMTAAETTPQDATGAEAAGAEAHAGGDAHDEGVASDEEAAASADDAERGDESRPTAESESDARAEPSGDERAARARRDSTASAAREARGSDSTETAFVVKPPAPPPPEVPEPFVVKPPLGGDERERTRSKRRTGGARTKKRTQSKSALPERSQRPIDDDDPYAERSSEGRAR